MGVMTITLVVALNVVLAVALLGLLGYAMSHPRKLEPHVPEAVGAPVPASPEARVRRHARRTGHRMPARLQTALD
jgi:hypothetical protein